jgi:hypothetical protein
VVKEFKLKLSAQSSTFNRDFAAVAALTSGNSQSMQGYQTAHYNRVVLMTYDLDTVVQYCRQVEGYDDNPSYFYYMITST